MKKIIYALAMITMIFIMSCDKEPFCKDCRERTYLDKGDGQYYNAQTKILKCRTDWKEIHGTTERIRYGNVWLVKEYFCDVN